MTRAQLEEKRRGYLLRADCTEVAAILESAFEEDDREHSKFDAIGFGQFCPEDKPEHVHLAWRAYCSYWRSIPKLGEMP